MNFSLNKTLIIYDGSASCLTDLGVLGDAVIQPAVARLQGQDLRPPGDHVGLGPAPHLDGDGLVVAGQEDRLPLHRLELPGDAGGGEAPGLAVQGQVGAFRPIRVLANIQFSLHSNTFRA